jgi:DNA polymerase III subunit gamma/tau
VGQALYRKYRSKKLSEIVGQEYITRTLENAIKTGKLSHAYLFTGPRGVGKTSIARILAHEINGLPYTDESMHMDIIEIDAASNRRIDEIRELRDKVHIAPTSAKYKVYIIDEVHMLTKEAFNALLKTLEEPPAHVIFILATTELHKLPETIVSRTQRFTFKSIEVEEAVSHLKYIADKEGMEVDDDALRLLALHGRGSFRDSIGLLDQVGNSKKSITKNDAEKIVGMASNEHIIKLYESTFGATPADIVIALDQLVSDGIGPAQTAKQLSAVIRERIIGGNSHAALTQLLGDLLQVNSSQEPTGQLEVALFRANLAVNPNIYSDSPVSQPNTTTTPEKSPVKRDIPEKNIEKPTPEKVAKNTASSLSAENTEWWNEVLYKIKSANNTLYGVLRMAEIKVENDILHLKFAFGFHKKKAADASTQAKIRKAIKEVTGKNYQINAVLDKTAGKKTVSTLSVAKPQQPIDNPSDGLASITNVFGGGEVLDS